MKLTEDDMDIRISHNSPQQNSTTLHLHGDWQTSKPKKIIQIV